jgi:benzil reductase ((S)-benzoin forming)
MFSRVIKEEHPDVNMYSIAPGVVDTEMQRDIREVDAKDFADVDRFRSMKAEGELKSSEDVARVFVDLLENKEKTLGTVFSLRDL